MKIIIKIKEQLQQLYLLDSNSRPLKIETYSINDNLTPHIRKYQNQGFDKGVFYVYGELNYFGTNEYVNDNFNLF